MSEQITLTIDATEMLDWRHAAKLDCRTVEEYMSLVLRREMYGCLRMKGLEPTSDDASLPYRRERKNLKHLQPEVWRKSGGECFYCHCALDPYEGWHIDHVTPFARGGSDEIGNLVAACAKCNHEKHKNTVADFAARRFTKVAKHSS